MTEPVLSCPRCTSPMSSRIAVPRPGASRVRADFCERCGGTWLDERELAEVGDELGGLPFRMSEVIAAGTAGKGIASCPRCARTPIEVALLDVSIDVCPGCRGVWLDGTEYEALARASALEDARQGEGAGDPTAAHAAKTARGSQAARAVKRDVFTCPRCAEERAVADGYLTSSGIVCGPCFHQHEEAALLAEASRSHGEDTARYKEGAFRPYKMAGVQLGPTYHLLGFVIETGPLYCERCGRRRDDPDCTHH